MSEIDDILKGAPEHKPGAGSTKAASPATSEIDQALKDAPAPARGFKGWAQDVAATAVKGAIGVPEALVGLADIPTGGAVGKFLENEGGAVGFRPKQAKEIANQWHSDATLEAQRKVQEAQGFGGKLQAAIENPSVIATAIGESLPAMGAGGVAARGLMAATRLGQMGAGGAALAGAIGEGVTGAGSAAEQIRQETPDGLLTPEQAALAGATGLATTAFGAAGGKLATKLGIGDAETMLAQGAKGIGSEAAQQSALKSVPKAVIQGAISEGLLEELPQSVAEQILQNIALGKDWSQDVDSAAVLGVLSGGVMGGGAAGLNSTMQPRTPAPAAPGTPPNPGLERVRSEFNARLADLNQQEAGDPAVPQVAPPDGRAVLNAQEARAKAERDAAIAASRAVTTPDDEIFQSTGANDPPKRSEQMGLNPAAGTLSASASVAVDTGAADHVQQQADAQAKAEADADTTGVPVVDYADLTDEDRAAVDDYYRRMDEETRQFIGMGMEDDDGLPDFDTKGDPSTENFLRSLGASEQEIQDAISTTSAPAGPLQGAASNGAAAPDVAGSAQQGAGAAETQAQGQVQGLTATQPATTGEPANGTQAPQAVQAAPQGPAQPASQGLTDAAAQTEAGAPMAPAQDGAGKTADEAGASAGSSVGRQDVQRAGDGGSSASNGTSWDELSTAQRGEVAARAGLPKILAANIPSAAWDHINPNTRAKLEAAMVQPAAPTSNVQNAPQEAAGSKAQAAPVEAGPAEAGNASAAAGVPAATGAGDVQADGVKQQGANDASQGEPAGVRRLAKSQEAMQRPEGQALEGLRREGDQDVPGVGGKLQGVLPAYGGKADEASLPGPRGQQQGLRAGELPVGDGAAAGSEPPVLSSGDGVRSANDDSGSRQGKRNSANDAARTTPEARSSDGQGGDQGAASVQEGLEAPDAQRRDEKRPGVGKGSGNSGQNTAGADSPGRTNGVSASAGAGDSNSLTTTPSKPAPRGVLAKMADQKRTAALDRIAKGTAYFGTKDKAADFIEKSGIGDTHEVVQAKAGRFEIREKEAAAPAAAPKPEASAAAASPEKTVRVPADIEAAMAGQMNKQKARIRRLNNEVSAPGMTLADKVEVQAKIKAADATLRKMRQTIFDAEDAAVKAVETRDISAFAEHEMLFPDAYKAIEELIGATPAAAEEKPKGIVGRRTDGVMIREDENGVRYYTEGGVRITETVTMRPTRQGVQVSRGELKPEFMTAEELSATQAPVSPETPKTVAKPDPLTEKEKAAKAKMLGAAAKLADLLSKNTRANITPEQEQKMLPIVIELFEGAMDLGYVKFKQAARYVREFIAGAIDQDAADSIPIDTLQGAYIATARRHADKDITPKRDVITVETIADLEEPAESADTGAPENDNATSDQSGPQALDAVPAKDDGTAAVGRAAGAGAASGSEAGERPDSGTAAVRVSAARGGRGGTRRISDPQARADGEKRPRSRRAGPAGAGVPAGDAGPDVTDLLGGNQTAETASTPNIPAQNFRIEADLNLGQGGEVAKFNDNMAAIRIVKAIEADRRRATPEEQRILARFVGWGGLASAFPNPETGKFKPDWEKRGNELRDLLTPSEYRAASRSTRNAHYTSEVVVTAMWDAVRRLGYRNGLALESSVGSGNFLGLKPADIGARFIGVEYDSITARLAAALYPQATVLHSGFQDVALPDNAFDLVIGNPPFGDESLRFQYKPELRGVSIHNQFFRASLDALRPGGLQAQVVSSFLMDAQDKGTRMELAKKAKLVAAFRLPDTAFKENARTQVVTDIIILQRRTASDEADATEAINWFSSSASARQLALTKMSKEDRQRNELMVNKYEKEFAWVTTSEVADPLGGDPIKINSYFASNPGNIIGTLDRSGTMRTKGMMNVHLDDPATLGDRLRALVSRLPEGIVDTASDIEAKTEQAYKLLGEALRISVAREEPGHMTFDEDGKLARVIEREYGDGTVLQRQAINPGAPWSSSLFMDSEGRWYSVDVKMDDKGNKVKILKDGKPTKFNDYTKTVYQSEADIPASMRLSELDHDRLVALVNMRDLLKRQLVLETEDAVKVLMEGNRTKLAEAYKSYVDKHGPVNRRANAALVNEMPDGGLVLALESSYEPARSADQAKRSGLPKQDESAKPAPILSERVVPKYEPPTSAATPADALAITLSDRGVVDLEHIAKLLNTSPAEAEAALADGEKPLIFRDPETETFETANAYLSGHVRRKLMAAKAAGLSKNVQALEAVQPARWGAENVAVQIGSTWVPPGVYAEFAEHLLGGSAKVSFSQLTNTFAVNAANVDATKADQWSTEDLPGAFILGKLLNSQTPTVTRTDSDGKTYVDKEATALGMLKAREMVAEFGDWVFKDGDRRERLVEIFNEKFNTRVSRQYDGSHLKLPGKVPDTMIKMRRHQMNAIWRGISSRFTLIDHVVGAGKTFTAIARAMERRRMGLARKPTIVVPNHLVEQWQADVYRLYPAAKVLAATKKDFEKKNRRKLLSRVATGDYDIVILPHSSFGFVGISPETELRYLEEELATALAAVKEAEEQAEEDGHEGFRKPVGVKEAERLVARIEGRMARLREGARDRLLTFEQLGIDDLTIDEAHEFKNLFYSSRLTKVRGMGDKIGSRKAADLYNKVRVLRDTNGAVTFMTGTPVSNSVVELYTMMRYLASSELSELGMEHFDAWRTQFVDASPAFEPNESGRLQEVTRLGRTWSNMRSLMDLYYGFTDAVTNDDIKKWYAEDNGGKEFPIPKVKGGERQLRKVAPTQAQEAVLKEVIAGFDGLDDIKDIKERNATRLRLMDRARKLSLDVRAANPTSISDEKGGKLEQIADEVKRIYSQWSEDRGTQLIFLDRSVPKAKGDDAKIKEYDALIAKREKALAEDDDDAFGEANEALERFDSNEIQELRAAQAGGWNAYQQLKDNLVARGIPAAEIRFIQEANTDEQKQALFDAVNGGMVRVLIGSTPRMGAGTNVQQRLVGLHHADVTWKPSDIEQREGRIIRQGNQLLAKYGQGFEVEILAYATERTVDAKMWSLNATKLKAINGLRKYTGDFTMELEDEESVSMAEMAALASGNPLLLERVTLESSIQGLELQERAHRRKMYGAEDAVSNARRVIETYPGRIAETRQQAASLAAPIAELQKKAAARRVTVEGEEHESYKESMKAALAAVEKQQAGNDRARYVIDIAGQKVTSKEKIDEVIGAALGDDSEFEVEIEGNTFTQRTAAGRVASSILSPKAQNAVKTSMTGDLGRMLGMDLKFQMDPARYNEGKVDLVLWLERDGKTVVSGSIDSHDPFQAFTTASMRDALGNLLSEVEGKANVRGLDWMEQQLERATQDLPELESRVGAPFPKAQEIKEKRARLEEVVRALTVEPPAAEAADDKDDANFGTKDRGEGSPADRAVMAMAGEGKSADEILRFIANASKSPYRRQLARKLLAAKANPTVTVGGDMGSKDGYKNLAMYSRQNHGIVMAPEAESKAEQIFLHEHVHANTLLALDKQTLFGVQMKKLYESVQAQGLSDTYGMKNIGEFVAEAFTNPQFQKALKDFKAPNKEAADMNLWERFVAIVRKILQIEPAQQDALSKALELGAGVMRENMPLRAAKSFRAEDAPAFAGEDAAHFGMADAAILKQSALDQIHQSLSHPGKVSVWDKTVGTMRNLAERSPAFKPVFESAQRFIDDVSMLANETADVAPRLLPRVESWRDLTKKPVSAEDNKAISKPLFEGTLMWARDTDGKPVLVDDMAKKYADLSTERRAKMLMAAGRLDDRVLRMWQGLPEEQFDALVNSRFESQMLKPGVIWSDAELRSLFDMNDQQISLYREARKAIDRSIDLTARADMLRAVGTEYGAMRDVVLEAPTLADARDLLVDTLHADALEDESKADRLTALINTVGNRYESAVELIASGYAPLSRFGRYTVDVVDAAGERQYFGMSETVRDANQMADRMRAEFPGATVMQGTMSAEAYKLFAGITPESLELFGNMLGLDAEGGDARDKAFQEYLRLSKNNHSALKRLMHRKGIAGYSEDVGRVLASFTYSNARQAAGGLNAGTVEESINAIPKEQGELKDVAMGLRDYVRDPQEEGQAVRGMLFAQYLGGSVASAFVNMTQPVAVTLPWLSQYGGMKAAGAQLARAVKDMAGKATYEADLQTALGQAEEDGIVSPQEIHQLMAQARGAGTLRSGDGTRAGNARAAASNAWERTKVAWGQPFALAEQFNRRSTFIAAYRLAKERGMRAPAQFARRAVLETQFLYSKANKPKWARGAVGGTLFTFKTYSISYLELLNRMWTQGGPEGKRAVGWALATVMLMGGAGGLPFMEDLEDLIDGIAQLLGYNVSAKQWRRQALQDIVGKEMADFIDTGVSGLPGAPIDVSGRMGMGDLIPGTGMLLSKPDHSRDLMEVVGPAGDLVSRGFTGARKVLTGDVGGAALELAPSAVRNAAKGIDMAISDRYTDAKGYKVLDTTLPEAAAKFVGFQPRSVAKVQESNGFMMRSKSFYAQTSAEIKAEWARALFEKDDGALQDVRDRLDDWNRKNPEQQIVVKMPDVWKRVREMGKDRTQRIADTAPKALRQEMRNMARETG